MLIVPNPRAATPERMAISAVVAAIVVPPVATVNPMVLAVRDAPPVNGINATPAKIIPAPERIAVFLIFFFF